MELKNWMAQERAAAKLMAQYNAYAESIGCKVVMDEIECTEEQAALLSAWWLQHTNKP